VKTVAASPFIVASEFSGGTNTDDLERPWDTKTGF